MIPDFADRLAVSLFTQRGPNPRMATRLVMEFGECRGGPGLCQAAVADRIRDAILPAMTPDTQTPDIPWLLSIGFKARNYAGTNLVSPWARPAGGPVCHVEYDSLGGCDGWSIDDTLIPPMDTRAEVRALCAALKIPLTEAP